MSGARVEVKPDRAPSPHRHEVSIVGGNNQP